MHSKVINIQNFSQSPRNGSVPENNSGVGIRLAPQKLTTGNRKKIAILKDNFKPMEKSISGNTFFSTVK